MRERISKLKKKLQNQKGFTLVELMAVLAILALIVAIAVPAVGSILEKAKVSAAEANVEMLENAAELAYIGEVDLGDDDYYTATELVTEGFLKLEDADAEEFDASGNVLLKQNNSGVFKVAPTPAP